eukprot:756320-Rhodomonas_salina.1
MEALLHKATVLPPSRRLRVALPPRRHQVWRTKIGTWTTMMMATTSGMTSSSWEPVCSVAHQVTSQRLTSISDGRWTPSWAT